MCNTCSDVPLTYGYPLAKPLYSWIAIWVDYFLNRASSRFERTLIRGSHLFLIEILIVAPISAQYPSVNLINKLPTGTMHPCANEEPLVEQEQAANEQIDLLIAI